MTDPEIFVDLFLIGLGIADAGCDGSRRCGIDSVRKAIAVSSCWLNDLSSKESYRELPQSQTGRLIILLLSLGGSDIFRG